MASMVCTVKTCGVCAGAGCALGTVVKDTTDLGSIVCPWQRAMVDAARTTEGEDSDGDV